MANWNFISKLFSTIGTTAFGVGFTGLAVKGLNCHNNFNSIFGGGFAYPANNYNMLNYDITNPYAFLNANPISKTNSPSNIRKTQSAPPPTKCQN